RRDGGGSPASARRGDAASRLELAAARAARALTTGPADTIHPHEGDVCAVGPRRDGPARAHEEPRPRAHDEPAPQLHPPAAGAPLYARGEPAPRADRPVRGGGAADRGRDGEAPHPRLTVLHPPAGAKCSAGERCAGDRDPRRPIAYLRTLTTA